MRTFYIAVVADKMPATIEIAMTIVDVL